MLELTNLTKSYGSFVALDDVSFTISPGERVALLGANGSGKTTTVRSICRLLEWEEGDIMFDGHPIRHTKDYLFNIGAVLEGSRDLNWRLNIRQNAEYYAGLRQVRAESANPFINRMMERLDLTKYGKRTVGRLSTGNRQKTALLCALIHNPRILLLDEPTLGLDLETVDELERVLLEFVVENNQALLITSHDMSFIHNICSRVILLESGAVVFDGSVAELRSELFHYQLEIEISSEEYNSAQSKLDELVKHGRTNIEFTEGVLNIQYDEPRQVFPFISWLDKSEIKLSKLTITELSLEKAYKHMLSSEQV